MSSNTRLNFHKLKARSNILFKNKHTIQNSFKVHLGKIRYFCTNDSVVCWKRAHFYALPWLRFVIRHYLRQLNVPNATYLDNKLRFGLQRLSIKLRSLSLFYASTKSASFMCIIRKLKFHYLCCKKAL